MIRAALRRLASAIACARGEQLPAYCGAKHPTLDVRCDMDIGHGTLGLDHSYRPEDGGDALHWREVFGGVSSRTRRTLAEVDERELERQGKSDLIPDRRPE